MVEPSPARVATSDDARWQVIVRMVFVESAILLAWTGRVMMVGVKAVRDEAARH